MNFSDNLLYCERCGGGFVFTVTEQRKLAEAGLEIVKPKYCPRCRQLMPIVDPNGKAHGRVKWFSGEKGYGFITLASGEEIFVHRSGLAEGVRPHQMSDGQEVEFEVEETIKGPQAVQVMPANSEG
jgi:CspA family cold shock protein